VVICNKYETAIIKSSEPVIERRINFMPVILKLSSPLESGDLLRQL
jgi:hypothetical protein